MKIQQNKTIAQHIGREGEKRAAEWLWLKGFDIVDTNCRVGRYEIDLVCKHNEDWVFVEVKTRSEEILGNPEIAVNYKKRQHLQKAALGYLKNKGSNVMPRVDVVAVSLLRHGAQMMYFKGK